MSKQTIQVPNGLGAAFRLEMAKEQLISENPSTYHQLSVEKMAAVANTRKGNNDTIEFDDADWSVDDLAAMNKVVEDHDPLAPPVYSPEDAVGNFIKSEATRLMVMSPGNWAQEDTNVLLDAFEELGPEGINDQFIGSQGG